MNWDRSPWAILFAGFAACWMNAVAVAGPAGDINGDGKIGLEESIFALQIVAGLNSVGPKEIYPAMVERSGQTASYQAGDDGDLQRGVALPTPRFTDNGDDTVSDNLTGLMWTKDANIGSGARTWTQAISDCASCTAGGYSDWRLPQIRELNSLIHFSYFGPALSNTAGTGQWTEGDPFTNAASDFYWSSTTYADPAIDQAWGVDSYSGWVYRFAKDETSSVWCVRAGPN